MGWRDFKVNNTESDADSTLELMEREYLETLTLFRSPRAEKLSEAEAYNMVSRFDELFQILSREGRQLPVNTPEGRIYVRGAAREIQNYEESLQQTGTQPIEAPRGIDRTETAESHNCKQVEDSAGYEKLAP